MTKEEGGKDEVVLVCEFGTLLRFGLKALGVDDAEVGLLNFLDPKVGERKKETCSGLVEWLK